MSEQYVSVVECEAVGCVRPSRWTLSDDEEAWECCTRHLKPLIVEWAETHDGGSQVVRHPAQGFLLAGTVTGQTVTVVLPGGKVCRMNPPRPDA